MGACGSKHSTSAVIEAKGGELKSADLKKHRDTIKDAHSDGSQDTPVTAHRASSGHLRVSPKSSSPPQSIMKKSRTENTKEITLSPSDTPMEQDIAAAQRFREERMLRIQKRLEEAKAQVAEREKRVEALKSRNAAALTKINNNDKTEGGGLQPKEKQSSLDSTSKEDTIPSSSSRDREALTQQASHSSFNFKKVLETSALESNFYAQQQQPQSETGDSKPHTPSEVKPKEQSAASDTIETLKGKQDQTQDTTKSRSKKKRQKTSDKEIPSTSSRSYGRHDAGLSNVQEVSQPVDDELPSSSSRTADSYGASVCRSKRRASIATEPVAFSDITDSKLRRSALKLIKRLNHDPWDINNKYNDDEVFEFIEEHPETAAVRYDFEYFSGHIFPLSVLCTLGASLETIRLVYGAFPKAIDQCDPWIGTPLHYAMQHKAKAAVVSFLIRQHPFMLQERNQFGRLPLHMASLFKATSKTVSLLLEEYPEGADQVEKDGFTPLHLACENGSSAEVVKLLIDGKQERCLTVTHIDASTPLHLACANSANVAVVAELLTVGMEALDCYDAQGYAPLHVAVKHQASASVVKRIIEVKPEVIDMKTGQGYTVMSIAKKSSASAEVLKMLEG